MQQLIVPLILMFYETLVQDTKAQTKDAKNQNQRNNQLL